MLTEQLGTPARPLSVAIIGAGPSGFYAAGELLGNERTVQVDMFDSLPAPYGLVRYGVAPDHQKIKSVTKLYERTAKDSQFRFFGNVTFGKDINHDEFRQHYDAIIYAVGAQSDHKLNIPGEELPGSLSATEFVAWYNGHPDYAELSPNLQVEAAVVVGVGNVAMDVARILARSIDELKTTDIADYALDALRKSKIRDIYILSRRSPAQVKFTPAELKELGELEMAEVILLSEQLTLDEASAVSVADDNTVQKNLDLLHDFAAQELSGKEKRVHFLFQTSPIEFVEQDGRLASVTIEKNRLEVQEDGYIQAVRTGETDQLSAGLVLRSVGYECVPLDGVPYDKRRGILSNAEGRIADAEDGSIVLGEYVVGWAKHGPRGIIGTNKPQAVDTVHKLFEDIPSLTPAAESDPDAIVKLLNERDIKYITMSDWEMLDALEVEVGEAFGRPRVKITSRQDIVYAIHGEGQLSP